MLISGILPGHIIYCKTLFSQWNARELCLPVPSVFGVEIGGRGTKDWSFMIWHYHRAERQILVLRHRSASAQHLHNMLCALCLNEDVIRANFTSLVIENVNVAQLTELDLSTSEKLFKRQFYICVPSDIQPTPEGKIVVDSIEPFADECLRT